MCESKLGGGAKYQTEANLVVVTLVGSRLFLAPKRKCDTMSATTKNIYKYE